MPIRIRKEFFDLSNFIFQYGNRVVGFMLNVDNEPVDLFADTVAVRILRKIMRYFPIKHNHQNDIDTEYDRSGNKHEYYPEMSIFFPSEGS